MSVQSSIPCLSETWSYTLPPFEPGPIWAPLPDLKEDEPVEGGGYHGL